MIAVDASAIVAIIFLEPEAEEFDRRIAGQTALIGTPTLLEARQVVLQRSTPSDTNPIATLIKRPGVRIIPFAFDHYRLAAEAFDKFGKGRGHPAQLNFGDCMAYAIAKRENVPLLYKGDDFAKTDIQAAL